ncbi:MAG: hypothetical protein Q9163_005719 [Psora crenata]
MYPHSDADHRTRARLLVRQLVDEHDPTYGVGSMTCSIYDTAWVAMIPKQTSGQTQWLFPSAFDFLLKSQHADGGWHTSPLNVDGVLSTLAALLALCRHIATPHQTLQPPSDDLRHRRDRAVYCLETVLLEWDVATTVTNGYEILVSKLLHLLAVEGIDFNFPGRKTLNELKMHAAAQFNPSMLYDTVRSSVARSLEGLVGEIDFDQVGQHKISGSIMASPASTAAYLMYSSTWDSEAEDYLSHVLSVGNERSVGGVPSQYPTTTFEVTQCLSVLLANGFSAEELGPSHLEEAGDFLEACLSIDAGVTGSAPYVESDADNTAQVLTTLCHLGRKPSPHGLIVRFETRDWFKTYTHDRSPSFRTNCLVLKALLDLLPSNSEQAAQVEKTVRFITGYWWSTNGEIEDQLNSSLNYPTMLMVNALVGLVNMWEQGFAPVLDDFPLRNKVFICLYQALSRTLQNQNVSGSWGPAKHCEPTAYAILILTKLTPLSSAPAVKKQILQSIERARRYLTNNFRPLGEPDCIWRGKASTGSSILFQAYVLAALQAPTAKITIRKPVESRFQMSLARIVIQTKYYARQSWFAHVPQWQIQACLVEGNLFLPHMRDMRFAVFPKGQLKEDQYFETIPFAWLAANNFDRRFVGPEYLYQMMILSFLNRQLDDYVTYYVAEAFAGCPFDIGDILQDIFEELGRCTTIDQRYLGNPEASKPSAPVSGRTTASIADVRAVLYRFISHILHHPYIVMASSRDQAHLRSELVTFLHGRINRFSEQPSESPSVAGPSSPGPADDQTQHPYTFAFLSCLVGNQTYDRSLGLQLDFLDTPEQHYLAAALCRHISVISYMSSTASEPPTDYHRQQPTPVNTQISSLSLDRQHSMSISPTSTSSSIYSGGDMSPVSSMSSKSSAPSTSPSSERFSILMKHAVSKSYAQAPSQSLQLTRLLSHERRCLNTCLQSLDAAAINRRTANILSLFVDFSELSELVFRDPNIGSCYHSISATDAIVQARIPERPPTPPKKAAARGNSVAAARAALAREAISKSDDGSAQGKEASSARETLPLGQDGIACQGPTTPQRECNWNRPTPSTSTSRSARSSLELLRNERIVYDAGDSSQEPLPNPRSNPILREYLQNRPGTTTEGESVYSSRQIKAKVIRRIASATNSGAEFGKGGTANARSQKKIQHELQCKASAVKQAHEADRVEASRRRASSLQTMAMVEAARDMSVQEPILKRGPRATDLMGNIRPKAAVKVERDLDEEGDGTTSPSAVEAVEQSEEMHSKRLHRAFRLGGPKLKLPF